MRLNVNVIITNGSPPTRAAKEATSTIPIVMTQDANPVGSGHAASLARPSRNITGLSNLAPEISTKRLELLKELVPSLSRVTVLGTSTQSTAQVARETELAAKAFGVQLDDFDVTDPKDIGTAFQAAIKGRAEALLVLQSGILNSRRKQIVELAAKNRLPAMYYAAEWVEDGGLMSYSANVTDLFRRCRLRKFSGLVCSQASCPSPMPPNTEAFRQGLRELGYVEGKNILVEYRWAEGKDERYAILAAELVSLGVDVILAQGTQAAIAAKQTTTTIPIVVGGGGDLVGEGLIASLARPGGNLTGFTNIDPDLSSKRLQLLSEIFPKVFRAAVLYHGGPGGDQDELRETQTAAKKLRLRMWTKSSKAQSPPISLWSNRRSSNS